MEEIKVTNKEELENAVKEKQQNIVIVGEMAQIFIKSFEKKRKLKKAAKITAITGCGVSAVAIAAGIILAPATGGASAVLTVPAMAHAFAAFGTVEVSLTTTEVFAVCGVLAAALGCGTLLLKDIFKHYDIKIKSGETEVALNRKNKNV